MTRLAQTGFEWGTLADFSTSPDGDFNATETIVTSGQRSGSRAVQLTTTSDFWSWQFLSSSVASRTYYGRVYVKWAALPDSTVRFCWLGNGAGTVGAMAKITSGGKLQLFGAASGGQVGSDSAETITTGVFYCVELQVILDGSKVVTGIGLRLNGAAVASTTGVSQGTMPTGAFLNVMYLDAPGSSKTMTIDDAAANDGQGAVNNSWCGPGKVSLLIPISDSQVGSWTGGAGGTSSLFDAVNNIPPTGTASETNTTQIESADNSPDNSTDEYRVNMTTYTNGGVAAADRLNALDVHLCHGEDSGTNTKAGKFQAFSNPADGATFQTFTFGEDLGALGTFPSNWRWTRRVIEQPSVTLASSPVVGLRKTTASTAVGSVCAIGVYVDFTPPLTAAVGQVTETETAQPVTRRKTVTLGQASETDAAQAVTAVKTGGGPHVVSAGQAAETDTAQAVTARKTRAVGQAADVESAQPVTARKTRAVGQTSETDAAQAATARKTRAAGQASETDAAQAVTARKTRALGQASETDTAQPITVAAGAKVVAVGQATETAVAQPVSVRKTVPVGQTLETNTGHAVVALKRKAIGQAAETSAALALTAVKAYRLGQAAEADTAAAIAALKTLAIGQAVEVDAAQAILAVGGLTVVARLGSSVRGRTGSSAGRTLVGSGVRGATGSAAARVDVGGSPGGRVNSNPGPE